MHTGIHTTKMTGIHFKIFLQQQQKWVNKTSQQKSRYCWYVKGIRGFTVYSFIADLEFSKYKKNISKAFLASYSSLQLQLNFLIPQNSLNDIYPSSYLSSIYRYRYIKNILFLLLHHFHFSWMYSNMVFVPHPIQIIRHSYTWVNPVFMSLCNSTHQQHLTQLTIWF